MPVTALAAASFFPTTKIIQRSVELRTKGTVEPMTEKLASRLKADANRGATSRLTIRRQGSFNRAPVTASRDEGAELAVPDSIEERLAAAAAFHAQFVVR